MSREADDGHLLIDVIAKLVGLALRRANAVYLVLAAEAALLLYGVEARIENRSVPPRQPHRARSVS